LFRPINTMLQGLWRLVTGAIEAFIVGTPYASPSAKGVERKKAEEQFRACRVVVAGDEEVFSGESAQVLEASETFSTENGKVRDFVLTIFAVTPDDRYFLFKSNEAGKAYLNELSVDRAKLVLKTRFRPYVASDA
jgi:hypothetical protein